MSEPLAADREEAFWAGVEHAGRFFKGEADVQRAVDRLAGILEERGIPYAIIGAMALNEWGYRRVTVGVDVLLTADGLQALKAEVLGRGYVEKFPGSRGLRDTRNNVTVDVVLAGEYPGDGKPKPVAFPDPARSAIRGRKVALLPLEKTIELKLASGSSARIASRAHRDATADSSDPREAARGRRARLGRRCSKRLSRRGPGRARRTPTRWPASWMRIPGSSC